MPWTYTIANVPLLLRQTATRHRDAANGASFAARAKGHAPHLSISDDSHHVTETIGFLYGDEDERDAQRAPHGPSAAQSSYYRGRSTEGDDLTSPHTPMFPTSPVSERPTADTSRGEPSDEQGMPPPRRKPSFGPPNGHAPPRTLRARDQSPHETAQARFPLNDIDYESSPAAVAQELSNLQALRRMSMDVHAAGDPDLPTLNPAAIPNAPSPTASDDDSSRLFWVPARLHPELAPKEFKTFLESKAEQIKRRSGDLSSLGASPMSSRSGSFSANTSGLSRKKSMLSREVNGSTGYKDGAEILERKRSESHQHQPSDPNLAELETLVANNMQVQRPNSPDENGDFILPSVPSSSLKRSTKTKYQRGGRGGGAGRSGRRAHPSDPEASRGDVSPVPEMPAQFASFAATTTTTTSLADTLSLPASRSSSAAQNFSRPAARTPSPPQDPPHAPVVTATFESILGPSNTGRLSTQSAPDATLQRRQVIPPDRYSVPQIVETPPPGDDEAVEHATADSPPAPDEQSHGPAFPPRHPARTSSRESPKTAAAAPSRPTVSRTDSSANAVSTKISTATVPPASHPTHSLDQPSPLPGNDTNSSNLSIIPTLTVDKQPAERKEAKKSSWGWLLGKDDDKDKDKGKGKVGKGAQSHDGTRLDVLQTSIDGSAKRRETIELDRDSLRLEEERKKESHRKLSSHEKKDKDNIFSSLFSSKKSRAEKEAKKHSSRLSPEPRLREMRPDIDYSWTRFSILEERAIYRMAHIKLANPRRPLYSQVLLSNFMYSYLAKVQAMHPQMNLPTSAKQQKKQKDPPTPPSDEFSTYQRYQQQQQQHAQNPGQPEPATYEGQYASTTPEQLESPSSTTGSGRHGEMGPPTSQYTNHNSYSYRGQSQQPPQQYETDRENEMW